MPLEDESSAGSPGLCLSSDSDGGLPQKRRLAPDNCILHLAPEPDLSESSSKDFIWGPDDTWEVSYNCELFSPTPKNSQFFHNNIIEYSRRHNFGIKFRRSRRKGKRFTRIIMCDKNTEGARPPRNTQRNTTLKKDCECPFEIKLNRSAADYDADDEDGGYVAIAVNLTHRGHGPSKHASEYRLLSFAGARRNYSQFERVLTLEEQDIADCIEVEGDDDASEPCSSSPIPPVTVSKAYEVAYKAWVDRKAERRAREEEDYSFDPFFESEVEGDPEPEPGWFSAD